MKLTKLFALSAVLAPVVLAATLSPDALANQSKSPQQLKLEMQAQNQEFARLQQMSKEMREKQTAENEAEARENAIAEIQAARESIQFTIEKPKIEIPVLSLDLEQIISEPPRENYVGRQLSVIEAETEREIASPEEANEIAEAAIIPDTLTLEALALEYASGEAQRKVAADDTEQKNAQSIIIQEKPVIVADQTSTEQIAQQVVAQNPTERSEVEQTVKPIVGSVVIDEGNDTEAEKVKAAEAEAQRLAQEEAEKVKAAEAEAQRLAQEEADAKAAEAEAERLAQEEAEKVKAAEAAEAERLAQEEAEKVKAAEAEAQRLAESSNNNLVEEVSDVAIAAQQLLDQASEDEMDEGEAQRIAAAISEVEDTAGVLDTKVDNQVISEDELSDLKVELEDAKKQLAEAKEKLSEKDKKFAKLEEKNKALTNAYCEQKTDYLELSNKIESFETSFLGGINEKFDMLTQLLTMNLLAQQGPQTPSLYNFNPGLSSANPRLQYFGLENGLRLATLNDFFDSRSLRNNMMNGNTTVYNVTGDFYAGGYMHNPVEGGFYNGDYTYQSGFQTPAAGSLNYPTVNAQPFAYDFSSGVNDGQRSVGQQDTFVMNQPVVNRSMIEANVQRMNSGQQIFQRQPTAEAQSQREQNVVR